jgi:hypothetical protein
MSSLSSVPSMRKGALIQGSAIIPFQYTPEKLTRTLTANALSSASSDLTRIKGPPGERIDVDVLLDATDQLERGQSLGAGLGVYPSLSALEMLLYPSAARVIGNAALSALGVMEIIPPQPALTVLVWGILRVVPVQVQSFSVHEEQFDSALTPLRATVKLGLKVLSYSDLGLYSAGGMLALTNHVSKEALSYLGSTPAAGAMGALVGQPPSGVNWSVVGSAMNAMSQSGQGR